MDVLDFDFGGVQMTVADINEYLAAVDLASDRVVVAEAARRSRSGRSTTRSSATGPVSRGLQSVKAGLAVL